MIVVEPVLRVFLIDGSGSMEVAWDAAWSAIFELARESPAFAILIFKEKLSLRDRLTIEQVRTVTGRDPTIPFGTGLLINYGEVLRAVGNHRLKRRPEPLITFGFRTPLCDAVAKVFEIAEARFRRTGVPYEIYVLSDNRDNGSAFKASDLVAIRRLLRGLRRIKLIAVGDFLEKYLDPYDEVVRYQRPTATGLGTSSTHARLRVPFLT